MVPRPQNARDGDFKESVRDDENGGNSGMGLGWT